MLVCGATREEREREVCLLFKRERNKKERGKEIWVYVYFVLFLFGKAKRSAPFRIFQSSKLAIEFEIEKFGELKFCCVCV